MDVNGNPADIGGEVNPTDFNSSASHFPPPSSQPLAGESTNTNFSATPPSMTKDAPDSDLPSQDQAKEFYAKYEPRDILGKGISSTVRRVIEKGTGREYAVKIVDISGERVDDAVAVHQTKVETRREVNILHMCAGHPNIIELHDFFQTETYMFLVFELCRNGELFDYLTREVSLSEKRTRFFMHQLLEVVKTLHSRNIVHRDLKPENILLDDGLNVKVSDFGFATVLGPNEQLTELLGTPGYLAPETLKAATDESNTEGYGMEVDLWACGVIMYTLLCGSPPFWHRKQMLMLRAIMDGRYSFASPLWMDVSETAKDLISKLLVVDPASRLTAMQALLHPFFERDLVPEKKFDAKKVFRSAVLAICFFFRMKMFHQHPPPVEVDTVKNNPYQVRIFRRLIDGCAFGMYAHWVKRGENQNRAALFEHTLRDDWKQETADNSQPWSIQA
ncbi:phosphorylase b kinase gamma catalytic chain, skeletal muscle/heart isoform-like isoform X2 [Babylonia areolata]|uniref:phosphorylase b kinase gamma catalytic chain, skeletal muscle/heart isoform-like isoform X2 n=1 Tax=Babylonia areolata TaxID=304850 RepID=UPI003FD5C357